MSKLEEIKVKDLKDDYISHEDVETVKTLAKALKFKYTIATIFISIFLFVTSTISIPDIISFNFSIEIFAFFLLSIFFMFLLIHVIKSKKAVKNLTPTKAQYGNLKEKYIDISRDENGETKDFYMDVVFNTNNTVIQRVETSRQIYLKSKLGDKILVVSFDGKKAYGIKSNSR